MGKKWDASLRGRIEITDYKFLLVDRIQKIRQIIRQYGEDKFVIAYSGGLDSNVLSALVDLALPENMIPRVYSDTGIEMSAVRKFVQQKCEEDPRFEIVKPKVPIQQMLKTEGYPFKSKRHCHYVDIYQRLGMTKSSIHYLDLNPDKHWSQWKLCPKVLRYQFTPEFTMRLSNKCCDRLKKDPMKQWQRERERPYSINGITRDEKGVRESAQCLAMHNNKLVSFQPLVVVTKDWEHWFIDNYNIDLPDVYYPPYDLPRTGCVGCPFNIKVADKLRMLKEFFPTDYKVACAVWRPVYDEYARIGYRGFKNDPRC